MSSAFLLTFTAQLVNNLQGLVVLPIVIRSAGPAVYGAYILVNITVAQFFALLATGVAYRYTRNLVSASSSAERRRLFEPQFNFQLVAFAIVAGCLLLAGPGVEKLFNAGDLHIDPWLLIGLVAANVIQRQVNNYYRYTLRLVPYNIVVGGTPMIFVAMLTGFVVVSGGLSLDSLLAVQILSSITVSLPFAVAMLHEIGLPRVSLPFRTFWHDFRAGLSLTLDMVVDFILGSGDRYLITLYLSVTDVGRYQPAYQLASVVLFLPRLVVTVLSPIVSRLVDAGDRAEAERIVQTSLSLFLMLGIPFVAGTLMIGPSLILLLTNSDVAEASRWVAPFVAAGMVSCGIIWILETVVVGLNRLKLVLIADFAGAAVNLGLNVVLLPLFKSITVPAVATFVGYTVSAAALGLAIRPLWKLRVDWVAIARICVAAVAMGGLLWLLGFRPGVVDPVGVPYVAGSALAGAAAYFAILSAIGGFGRRELSEIKALLASRAPATGDVAGAAPAAES